MFNSQVEEDLVECPYDETHRVLRKRLQIHLLRCRKTHPDTELKKCPFNAVHLIPEPEYTHHVLICPDRKLLTQYKYNVGEKEVEEDEVLRHEKIEDDENWDDMDNNVPDFKPTVFTSLLSRDKKDIVEKLAKVERSSRSRSQSPISTHSRSPVLARSKSRSPVPPRRSRSPLDRFPLVQPKKEYFPPRREHTAPRREYVVPKREMSSAPRYSYPRYGSGYGYGYQHEDPSQYHRNFRTRPYVKKEAASHAADFYELDEDPYYNGGS